MKRNWTAIDTREFEAGTEYQFAKPGYPPEPVKHCPKPIRDILREGSGEWAYYDELKCAHVSSTTRPEYYSAYRIAP